LAEARLRGSQGGLNPLDRRIGESDNEELASDLGANSASPIVDVDRVGDLQTSTAAAHGFSHADNIVRAGGGPHKTHPRVGAK
jgi:hypothetical protein